MRRRRQKNTLLPKMIGIAVLVNAVLLPILAQLGVFKGIKGGQRITPVELVKAPPPPPKPKARANKRHVAHRQPARRAAPKPSERIARSNEPKVRVVASAPTPSGSGQGDSGITTPEGNTGGSPASGPAPTPAPAPAPTPPPAPTPAPAPAPAPAPTPAPTPPPPAPRVPVLVPASVVHRVDPQIPSDFADQNLPATFRAVFHIQADGTVTVEKDAGTGSDTLDQVALEAARHWTFHPATEDGKPVDSYLRLTVNFVPSDEG